MEIVASAKGSPMMRPIENEDRPLCPYPLSIFPRDGEPREPYEGICSGARAVGRAQGTRVSIEIRGREQRSGLPGQGARVWLGAGDR